MTGPHQKDRRCCWCSICSSIQRAALRTGHAQTQQIYTVLILHFHRVCANKRCMHLSYWCSYGFPGNPSSIKMARVGRGSDEDQQQCPCAEKIKTCSSRFADRQPTGKQPTPPSSPSSQKKIDQLLVPTSPISP